MAVTQQKIIEAIEESFFLFPEVPGLSTNISVPGVVGHYSPISSPETNMVGKTRLTEENADATIEQVKDIFRRQQVMFGWLVAPSTEPADFPAYLERAGFAPGVEMAGMALTDLSTPMNSNPSVFVRRANSQDIRDASSMITRSYGFPEEAAEFLAAYFSAMNDHLDYWVYLASTEENAQPVAWAATLFVPNTPVVVLQGAGTLPEHRGHGLYSTLVAHRLQDARERGMEVAVIQANRATSAPIAARLGFQELCSLTLFVWDPASESALPGPR